MSDDQAPTFSAAHWPAVKLVVFDMDGTLYDQRPVRRAMALALAVHVVRTGRWRDVRALSAFRRARERMGDEIPEDFQGRLYERLKTGSGLDRETLDHLVAEWMHARPLEHLMRARAGGVDRLFDRLRASGRTIGIWSDYPAHGKLNALGLKADHVACADDADLGCLKPSPKGLQALMTRAQAQPSETLVIGDRDDRDGEGALRAGAFALLRGKQQGARCPTFLRYDDPIFDPVLTGMGR